MQGTDVCCSFVLLHLHRHHLLLSHESGLIYRVLCRALYRESII